MLFQCNNIGYRYNSLIGDICIDKSKTGFALLLLGIIFAMPATEKGGAIF